MLPLFAEPTCVPAPRLPCPALPRPPFCSFGASSFGGEGFVEVLAATQTPTDKEWFQVGSPGRLPACAVW
jgi:hypothetical protein